MSSTFGPGSSLLERRHITVVFCDLVDSSALAISMDAEDYAELIRIVLLRVTEIVERFGGFVAHYLGDGTLNYFGYPSASEDDTARAVRAGLAMAAAVAKISSPDGRRLAVRIGIAAGEVMVGDIMGAGGPRGPDLAGELPSLAARLQEAAKPGTVVVDELVRRIVQQSFECRNLGKRRLKGWNTAVTLWQVRRALPNVHQSGHLWPHLPQPVGRTSEAAMLAKAWLNASTGAGGAVLLVGDAGIGKSRIVADLLQATAGEDHATVFCICSALQQGVPLSPCIPVLARAAGFVAGDDKDSRRAKLRISVGRINDQDFELIADLLGLSFGEGLKAGQMSLQKKRERTISAIIGAILLLSERQPVIIVFEDIHWSDPTTAELLDVLVRRIAGRPVLLLMTARPTIEPAWADHPHADVVRLEPLSAIEARELISSVIGADRLTRESVREIVERSDGIPLYIEEITKAAIEAGICVGADTQPFRPRTTTIPSTIHSSLLARLDRLGNARGVAEVAAAIGRDFSLELLVHVIGQPAEKLWPALSRLMEAGLVLPCPPDGQQFRFKHAVIQDVAYGLAVRGRRLALHARIVEALEAHFPKLAAAEPQFLAHHCTEAGFADRAAQWWLRAGTQSLLRSATSEALVQLARGLAAAGTLPPGQAQDQVTLGLRIAHSKALIATRGYARPETGEVLALARGECERLGRPAQFLTVLHGQWSNTLFRGELHSAKRQADMILRNGEEHEDSGWLLVGCYAVGITGLPLGMFTTVREMIRRGLALAAVDGHKAYEGPIVPEPTVIMRIYLSWALMCMGHMDEARQECSAALVEANRLGNAFTLCFALWQDAFMTLTTVSVEAALPRLQAVHRLATEIGNTYYEAVTTLFLGWSQAMLGSHAAGLALMREGSRMYLDAGNRLYVPSYMRMEAEVLGLAGRLDEAFCLLSDAERMRDEMGAIWDEAEFRRTRGELLWTAGRIVEAEEAFSDAIRIAQERSVRLFALTAAMAFSDRLAGAGRQGEAVRQLDAVCAGFEGLGSFTGLMRARAVLDLGRASGTPA